MNIALAVCVVGIFAFTIERLKLAAQAQEVLTRASACLSIIQDPSLDDEAKERQLQRHALRLFTLLGILVGGSLLGLLLPIAGIWLLDAAGLASLEEVLIILYRVDFLVGTLIFGIGAYLVYRRIQAL